MQLLAFHYITFLSLAVEVISSLIYIMFIRRKAVYLNESIQLNHTIDPCTLCTSSGRSDTSCSTTFAQSPQNHRKMIAPICGYNCFLSLRVYGHIGGYKKKN